MPKLIVSDNGRGISLGATLLPHIAELIRVKHPNHSAPTALDSLSGFIRVSKNATTFIVFESNW
jgi:hypothetical protein